MRGSAFGLRLAAGSSAGGTETSRAAGSGGSRYWEVKAPKQGGCAVSGRVAFGLGVFRRHSTPIAIGFATILIVALSASASFGRSPERESRIVGGQSASQSYPFFASLIINGEPHLRWIANRTDQGSHRGPLRGRVPSRLCAGDARSAKSRVSSPGESIRQSDAIEVHPDYDAATSENDIAVVTLSSPVTQAPATLASIADAGDQQDGDILRAIGHGTTSEGGSVSAQLLEVDLPVEGDVDCQPKIDSVFGPGYFNAAVELCAAPDVGGKDTCQGDSGGPLFKVGTPFTIFGATSYGNGCARPSNPGVYAEIAALRAFIDAQAGTGSTTTTTTPTTTTATTTTTPTTTATTTTTPTTTATTTTTPTTTATTTTTPTTTTTATTTPTTTTAPGGGTDVDQPPAARPPVAPPPGPTTTRPPTTTVPATTTVVQPPEAPDVLCRGQAVTIVGSGRPDVLVGTPQSDVIAGFGGKDTITGLAGNDVICGGGASDRINGNGGDDQLQGEGGNDRLQGGDGDDELTGNAGNDALSGNDGNDNLNGGPGDA